MIEDPKLTLKILQYFARDEIDFPSNKTFADLAKEFPEETEGKIFYHVFCAEMNGLLVAKVIEDSVMGPKGRYYLVAYMDGLTPEGGNYVQAAESKGVWDMARERIAKAELPITTELMKAVMKNCIGEIVGI